MQHRARRPTAGPLASVLAAPPSTAFAVQTGGATAALEAPSGSATAPPPAPSSPPPAPQPATPPPPPALPDVGVAAGADLQSWSRANVARELGGLGELHAHWIRHDFAWDAIEPQPGSFAWAGFDQWVSAARERNLQIIATVGYTPAWANGGRR